MLKGALLLNAQRQGRMMDSKKEKERETERERVRQKERSTGVVKHIPVWG